MRFLFITALILTAQTTFSQNHTLDSLYEALARHRAQDTVTVRTLLRICYWESSTHPVKSKALAEEAEKISNEINYTKGMGSANRYVAEYYMTNGDYGQATKYAYNMLRFYESMTFPLGTGQSYQLLGIIHQEAGDFEKAYSFYHKALAVYEKANSKRDIGYCLNSLGALHTSILKYDDAASHFLKSMAIRKEMNDEDGLNQSYGNLALVFMEQGNYEAAGEYFEKALLILQRSSNAGRTAIIYSNMGKMYTLVGNYAKAESCLMKSLALGKNLHQQTLIKETFNKLAELEKKRGKYELALKYFEIASSYRDSIYSEDQARQLAEVETLYETGKKDKMIQSLARDKEIQTLWTNIAGAAIMLLVVLFFVLYRLQRYRDSKNRQILNLEIDYLTTQHKVLSEKYKDALTGGDEKTIESQDQRLLKKAIGVVEVNMNDPLFGVEKMAREIGMSRTNLHRKIKAITGFPPSELIRSIRLRKAAVLLLNQAGPISQISYEVGFEDHSYFSKAFKKQFGVSPTEYVQSRRTLNPLALAS